MSKIKEHSKYGELISSVEMKNGKTMYAYRNGNMVYFIVDDKVDANFHVDDVEEIMGAFLGIESESDV